MSKYNVGLKTLLLQGLSEPEFYGNLVYKFRKIIGKKLLDKSNPWTKSLGPLDLGLVQLGLHCYNPWTSYLMDQTYTGTLGD